MVHWTTRMGRNTIPIDSLIEKLHCSAGFKCGCEHPQHVLDAIACLIAKTTNAPPGLSKAELEVAMRSSTPRDHREDIKLLLDASCELLREEEDTWLRNNYREYHGRMKSLLNSEQMRLAKTVFDVSLSEEERDAAGAAFKESVSRDDLSALEAMLGEDNGPGFEALALGKEPMRWQRGFL